MSEVVVVSAEKLRSIVSQAVESAVYQAISSLSLPKNIPGTMSEEDAAQYLGCAANTLRSWRVQKQGPAYFKAGRSVRYTREDLDKWKALNRVLTSDSPEVRRMLHEMSR